MNKREQLLAAAERCFVESGFHGARMAQIAQEARMSPGHIYHFFESKEEIIAALVLDHVQQKQCMLARFEEAGDGVIDAMIGNLKENVDSSTDPFWSALMLEITAEATRNTHIAKLLRTMDQDMKRRMLSLLSGRAPEDDLDSRLEVLIALFQGLGIRNIVNPALDKEAVVRLVSDVFETLLRRKDGAKIDAAGSSA